MKRIRIRRILLRLALSATSLIATMGLFELGLRLIRGAPPGPSPVDQIPQHIARPDGSFIYQLNPAFPGISSQGLRDREFAIPKPAGVKRVLVLGDSVTYGEAVAAEETFPKQLEQMLKRPGQTVEVINAGVRGYTAYNEVQYYLERGRLFQPDVVIVALCLNDVVDPVLHWGNKKDAILNVPDEAIPNPAYHAEHVLPRLAILQHTPRPFLDRFWLYIHARCAIRDFQLRHDDKYRYEVLNGRRWPIYLTVEDTLNLKVLMDEQSPEWRWLRTMYARLHESVTAEGAALIVLTVPIAWQLDKDYPYLPQELIDRYCRERGITHVDPLPRFRECAKAELFLGQTASYEDVWHLTARGHQLIGEILATFLARQGLVTSSRPS